MNKVAFKISSVFTEYKELYLVLNRQIVFDSLKGCDVRTAGHLLSEVHDALEQRRIPYPVEIINHADALSSLKEHFQREGVVEKII